MSAGNTSSASGRKGPPLPPRTASNQNYNASLPPYIDAPPPYESTADNDLADGLAWASQDPRASSTQSLPGLDPEPSGRRKLLLIYIHGFMGNEMSFRSFPAHVHNILTVLLAETHAVHSKIYPRYRSKRNISFARDDFSKWLEPHESSSTDVVLLGHSMGGLLSAEVVLMPAALPATGPLKHRILGSINFDVPFLGMHPGVVKSGLASIFNPVAEAKDQWFTEDSSGKNDTTSEGFSGSLTASVTDTPWDPGHSDPNFNPSFTNDVVLPMRDGWRNAFHFVHKHSGDLYDASKKLITSHMEFGGAMAKYSELKTRYARIRALEVDDASVRATVVGDRNSTPPRRLRFVNYYTACTGKPAKPKLPPSESQQTNEADSNSPLAHVPAEGEDQSGNAEEEHAVEEDDPKRLLEVSHLDQEDFARAAESLTIEESTKNTAISSSQQRELTHQEKENLRLEQEKRRMECEARRLRGERSPERSQTTQDEHEVAEAAIQQDSETIAVIPESAESVSSDKGKKSERPPKERTFCVLPPQDSSGLRDPCWVRVFMTNVDEVGAHCGLFFVDERYERLVGDVAERIEGWVKENHDVQMLHDQWKSGKN